MYQAFDSFLRRPTWSTNHPSDMQEFRAVLRQVIDNPDFDAEEMGRYFKQHGADDIWHKANHPADRINVLVKEAKDTLRKRAR